MPLFVSVVPQQHSLRLSLRVSLPPYRPKAWDILLRKAPGAAELNSQTESTGWEIFSDMDLIRISSQDMRICQGHSHCACFPHEKRRVRDLQKLIR